MADVSTPAPAGTPSEQEKPLKSGKTPRKLRQESEPHVRKLEDKIGRRDAKIDILKSQLTQVKRREMLLVSEVQRTRELAAESATQTSRQFMKMKTSLAATHERERFLRDQVDTLRSVASTCASSSAAVPSPDRFVPYSSGDSERIRFLERQLAEERDRTKAVQADLETALARPLAPSPPVVVETARPTHEMFIASLRAKGAAESSVRLVEQHLTVQGAGDDFDVDAVVVWLLREMEKGAASAELQAAAAVSASYTNMAGMHNNAIDNTEDGAKARSVSGGQQADNSTANISNNDNDVTAEALCTETTDATDGDAATGEEGAVLQEDLAVVAESTNAEQDAGEGYEEGHQEAGDAAVAEVDAPEEGQLEDWQVENPNWAHNVYHLDWTRYWNTETASYWFYSSTTEENTAEMPESFNINEASYYAPVYPDANDNVEPTPVPVAPSETSEGGRASEKEYVMVQEQDQEQDQVADDFVTRDVDPPSACDQTEISPGENTDVPPIADPIVIDEPAPPSNTEDQNPSVPTPEDNVVEGLLSRLETVQNEVLSLLPEGVDPEEFLSAVTSVTDSLDTATPSQPQAANGDDDEEEDDDMLPPPSMMSPDGKQGQVAEISHTLLKEGQSEMLIGTPWAFED